MGRSGSAVGKGDDTSPGQENRRPSVYGASSDPRTLRKSNSMQRGSGTSGTASGSPRSVLENQPGPKRGYERSGSGAAYQEARALYRSSSLARTSRDPQDPPQPGSARASQVEPSTFAEGGRTLRRASSVVGKTGKRVGTKSSQNPGGVPLQAVWENVAMCGRDTRTPPLFPAIFSAQIMRVPQYTLHAAEERTLCLAALRFRWCGQWCGQAPKDALTDDIDELHSKLDRRGAVFTSGTSSESLTCDLPCRCSRVS